MKFPLTSTLSEKEKLKEKRERNVRDFALVIGANRKQREKERRKSSFVPCAYSLLFPVHSRTGGGKKSGGGKGGGKRGEKKSGFFRLDPFDFCTRERRA